MLRWRRRAHSRGAQRAKPVSRAFAEPGVVSVPGKSVPGVGAAQMSVRSAAAWALTSQYAAFRDPVRDIGAAGAVVYQPGRVGAVLDRLRRGVSLVSFLQDFGVTRYVNGERDLTAKPSSHTAYTVSVAFAWSVALLALLASGPIASFYGDARLLPIARIIAASYLMVPLSIVPQATCQRRMDYKSNTMIELGSSICQRRGRDCAGDTAGSARRRWRGARLPSKPRGWW